MLKNVAIPLMLAASEAEAATEAQLKAAAMALKMDKDADIPELIAGDLELNECQTGSNPTIGDAANIVATKEQAVVDQTALYNAAIAPIDLTADPVQAGGAWTQADVARREAVAAAEAAEAAGTTLGDLLDDLNELQQDERAKAKLYYEAEVNFVNGEALESSTDMTHATLNTDFSTTITDLKTAADAAVAAATAAIADEEMSRNWLYCELGAVPEFTYDRDGDGTADHEASKPTNWWTAQVAPGTVYTDSTEPPSCDVPQVLSAGVATPGTANANEANEAACTSACTAASGPSCAASTYDSTAAAGQQCLLHETIIRPAIKYFTRVTHTSGTTGTDFLTAETDVAPVWKWNATLAAAQANLSITNATGTDLGGIDRNMTGLIAYYEGVEMKYKWLVAQRTREERFFYAIKNSAATALLEAKEQAYGVAMNSGAVAADYDMPASGSQEEIYGWPSDWQSFSSITNDTEATTPVVKNRFTAGEAGAAKELATAATARDGTAVYNAATVGSSFRLPNTRAPEADGWGITAAAATSNTRDYVTTWTKLGTSELSDLNTWITNNNSASSNASKLYTWWRAAYGASKIANDWNALMRTTASANQWDATAAAATADTSVAGGVTGKVCDNVGSWHDAAEPANEAACKASCVAYNKDTTNGMVMTTSAPAVIEWGTGIYLPRETTGGYWCSAFSFDNTADPKTCKINRQLLTAVNADLQPGSQVSGTWGIEATGGNGGICKNMTSSATPLSDTTAVTTEILNFADLADRFVAAYNAGKQTETAYTDMVADAGTQAGLETAWLQAYYYKQYWMAIEHYLTDSTASSTTKAYKDYWDVIEGTTGNATNQYTAQQFEKASVTALQNTNTDNLAKARNELAYKQVDIALKEAHVALLGKQLNRVQEQLDDLNALIRPSVTNVAGEVTDVGGELIAAQAKRQAVYDEYNAASGDLSVSAALTAKTNAAADVALRNMTTYPTVDPDTPQSTTGEGDLAKAKRDAQDAWDAAIALTGQKESAILSAESSATLAALRTAVETTGQAWSDADGDLDTLFTNMNTAKTELADAEKALAAATLSCQVAAYDKYRSALEDALAAREGNLNTIKTMLEALPEAPAPGTEGSRCEKALSNGTYRPKRGEEQCGGKDSGLCCGGARIWMKTGTTADSGWRTIETCQKEDAESYSYQPPRAPMALTMPTPVSAAFACIEGAKALAAAASAAAAAVYMLA